MTSVVLQLNVTSEGSSVTIVTPTLVPEFTPTPTTVILPTSTVEVPSPLEQGYQGFPGWLVMVLFLCVSGLLAYWLVKMFAGTRWAVRWVLCMILGGLLAYTYLAIRLPGATAYLTQSGWSGMIGVVLLGAAVGFGSVYIWFRLANGSGKRPD
jgi:hypothetical protein